MVKILSQAGDSLADIYDVKGSVAGIETLETRELGIIHEMGATVFAERLSGNLIRRSTGALLQNATWDLEILPANTPAGIFRILNVFVFCDAARVDRAQISLMQTLPNAGEQPVFIWDTVLDEEKNIRMSNAGGAAGNSIALVQVSPQPGLPILAIGRRPGQVNTVGGTLVFRGLTTGFGAGDVTVVALIYVASAELSTSLSSRGLPIPSW